MSDRAANIALTVAHTW